MTTKKTKAEATAPAKQTRTYDPQAQYKCVKGSVRHLGLNRIFTAGETDENGQEVTFDLSYRSPMEIKFLVEHKKVIAPA